MSKKWKISQEVRAAAVGLAHLFGTIPTYITNADESLHEVQVNDKQKKPLVRISADKIDWFASSTPEAVKLAESIQGQIGAPAA